jgi:hypothetical protein
MSRGNTRKKGDQLENYLVDLLRSYAIPCTKNAGSGSVRGEGDVSTKDYSFECKRQLLENSKPVISPRIDAREFEKIQEQAAGHGRHPVLVIENAEGNKYAVLDLDLFVHLILRIHQYEQED